MKQLIIIATILACVTLLILTGSPIMAQTVNDSLWVTDGSVYAIAISGNTIYIGGMFDVVKPVSGQGGIARHNIAAIDATTGEATSWNPGIDGPVLTIAVSGSTVYVGGSFGNIGGDLGNVPAQERNNIAALDATTGEATNWHPGTDDAVHALAISSSTVYAGGEFQAIGGIYGSGEWQERSGFAAFNSTTGNPTSWNPSTAAYVYALAISGSSIYVVGTFSDMGGQTRYGIAALDLGSGNATSWNPDVAGDVHCIAVSDSIIYVGGAFGEIGGQERNNIAAIDATTGEATNWNPGTDSDVFQLAISDSIIYAGGGIRSHRRLFWECPRRRAQLHRCL